MKKFKFILILVLILTLSAFFVGCTNATKNDALKTVNNAYITLDINPSIEIITGEDGLVVQVNALNDDAQVLLVDTSFAGQTVEVTVETLLQLATEMGYIDINQENAILITTETETPEGTEELENAIAEKVQKFVEERKIKLDLIKTSLAATEDIKVQAETLGVSVGKIKLITYAMAFDNTLTLEIAAEMSVRDLNKIIINGRKEIKDFYSEEVRNEYFEQKDEVKVEYKLKVVELINEKVQNAEDEKFVELLEESEASISDVKALYQAYYDELVNFEIPTKEEIETDNQEIVDQIKALNAQLQTLRMEIQTLHKSIHNPELTKEEITTIIDQIKEKVLAERELNKQIHELAKTIKGKWYEFINNENGQHGKNKARGLVNFAKNFGFEKHVDIHFYYKEITKKYQQAFAEINVDMDELEDLFVEELNDQFNLLEQEKELAIEAIMDELKTQSQIIREQMIEENKVLKDIWKNNHKGR